MNLSTLRLIFVVAGCGAILGCSSEARREARRQECLAIDWRTIGYEDGVAGYPGDHIAQHRKQCGKFGVTPNLDQYQAGRQEGLREFCRPANGFRVGARGGVYGGVCPANLDREFVPAYQSGKQLYALRSRVMETSSELQGMQNEIRQIDSNLVSLGAQMINPQLSHEQRAQMILDTKQMAERRGFLKAEIPQRQRDLEAFEHDLNAYQATLKYVE